MSRTHSTRLFLSMVSAVGILGLLCGDAAAQGRRSGGRRGGSGVRGGVRGGTGSRGAGGIRWTGHGIRNTGIGFRGSSRVGTGNRGFGSRSVRSLGRRSGGRSSGGVRFGIGSRRGGLSLSGLYGRRRGSSSFSIGFSSGFGYGLRDYYYPTTYYRRRVTPYIYYPEYAYGYYGYADPVGYVYPEIDIINDRTDSPPAKDADAVARRPAADPDRARKLGNALGRGDKAFELGDYDDAREEYVRALVLAQDDARAQLALGLAEFARGQYADSARALRAGVARVPHLAETSFDLAKAYGVEDDLARHRASLNAHLKDHPRDADAWFLAGFVRYFAGDRVEGVAALDRFLALAQDNAPEAAFVARAKAALDGS